MAAEEPARLFAIDRDGGFLHEFDRRRRDWTWLCPTGLSTLPARSWSTAAASSGFLIPADQRLTFVDLSHGPLPVLHVEALGSADRCIGGACIVLAEARVPVWHSGVMQLARHGLDQGAAWSFEPVHDAPVFSENMQSLSAPMATGTGVSWAGETGYVAATLGDGGVLERPVWRDWSGGFEPLLEHRPYVDPDGGVWQFGRVPAPGNRRSFAFERVAAFSKPELERVGGSVLAVGTLACRILTLRHKAWLETSPYNRELPGGGGDFLVPVQALGGGCAVLMRASDRNSEFVTAGPAGVDPPIMAGLWFQDDRDLQDLGVPVSLQSLGQISAFVFDGYLHVYDARENECARWKIVQDSRNDREGA